ncbi:hypothetical protein GCM10023311_25180 [Flaviramulus aquimarinus]|uniref:Uncharacterized protein n=1 Tax=Flaviramulus aquimarinus TaxID=1170456 RepID=A0ABP9FC43_9FLAO
MVKPETISKVLLIKTKPIKAKDIKSIDLNTFTTSVKPVCLIILLNEPITKKLIAETTRTNGSSYTNCSKSKLRVKLNLIK